MDSSAALACDEYELEVLATIEALLDEQRQDLALGVIASRIGKLQSSQACSSAVNPETSLDLHEASIEEDRVCTHRRQSF